MFQVIGVTGTALRLVAVVRKPYAVVTCTYHIACPWEVHVTLMSLPNLQGQLIQPHSPTLCTCKGGSEVLHVIVMEGENEAVIVW